MNEKNIEKVIDGVTFKAVPSYKKHAGFEHFYLCVIKEKEMTYLGIYSKKFILTLIEDIQIVNLQYNYLEIIKGFIMILSQKISR